MSKQLCYLITNFPTLLIGAAAVAAVLCAFSPVLTVCFLGFTCLVFRSAEQGREEGWYGMTSPRRRPENDPKRGAPKRAAANGRRYHYT